jgi:hypothetical protein
VCFTNFLLLVLIILVGVPSSYFDVGALRNEVTLLATPKAWPLGSSLGLDLVFVFILVEKATLLDHFVELSNEECHLFGSHVLITIFITIFLDHGLGG